jgi:2-polyprenyl-3-methyl-5-hydroxy-6-metoxy-1,4-benzoquinol methylase
LDVTDFVGPSGNATDKYGAGNPLTRFLLGRFLDEIDASLRAAKPSSILDVGCGEGVVTERMATVTTAPTTGVDLGDEGLRREWSRREKPGNLTFRAASAYDLPFDDGAFDCVCALEVFEHLERPREGLAELARVACRTLILSVPREPIWRIVHVLAGRDLRSLGNTPGHVNHWSAGGFERLVSEFASVTHVRRPFPWTLVVARTDAVSVSS